MAQISFRPTRAYPSIPTIGQDPESHARALEAIKEALEIHERRTNDYLTSFVRVEELVTLGLISLDGTVVEDAASEESTTHHHNSIYIRLDGTSAASTGLINLGAGLEVSTSLTVTSGAIDFSGAATLDLSGVGITGLSSDDLSDVSSIAMLDENEIVTGAWTFRNDAGITIESGDGVESFSILFDYAVGDYYGVQIKDDTGYGIYFDAGGYQYTVGKDAYDTYVDSSNPTFGDSLSYSIGFINEGWNASLAEWGFYGDTLFQFGQYVIDGGWAVYVTETTAGNWVYPFACNTSQQETVFAAYPMVIGNSGGAWAAGLVSKGATYATLSENAVDFSFALTGLTDLNFTGMTSVNMPALDVTGNIIVGGTVDGRDVLTDGTVQDAHIADSDIHGSDALVVHLAGTETITGAKTFTADIVTSTADIEIHNSGGGDLRIYENANIEYTSFAQIGDDLYITPSAALGEIQARGDALRVIDGTFSITDSSFNDAFVMDRDLNDVTWTFANLTRDLVISGLTGQVDIQQDVDVTGNIIVSGTVDGRDVAADGTAQDSHIADSTIHFTQAAISIPLSQLSDVDDTGVATNDLLYKSAGDWVDTGGKLTWDPANGRLTLVETGAGTNNLQIQVNATNANFLANADGFSFFPAGAGTGRFYIGDTYSSTVTGTNFRVYANNNIDYAELDNDNTDFNIIGSASMVDLNITGFDNVDITGNIVISGTVDGRDVATDGSTQDSHIADATIHFTEASIDHTAILNIGTNTHAQIDTHIADASIHTEDALLVHIAGTETITGQKTFNGGFVVDSAGTELLNITRSGTADLNITNSGSGDIVINNSGAGGILMSDIAVTGNITVTGTVDGRDVATDGSTQDSHIADATIHFTEASIDHTAILNIGTNTHAQIDTHIADDTIHYPVRFEYEFLYETTVAVSDPGTGKFGGNHVTWASMSGLRFNDADNNSGDAEWWVSNLVANDVITIMSVTDEANYLVCKVTAAPTDQTGWWSVPISVISSGVEPADNEECRIKVTPVGAAGFDELLPVGTISNASLKWDGADWIEDGNLRINAGFVDVYENLSSTSYIRLLSLSSTTKQIEFDTTTTLLTVGQGASAFEKLRVARSGSGALSIELEETATSPTAIAGLGNIWVKNDAPNTLYFTDDAGTDWLLNDNWLLNVVEDTTPQLGGNLDAQSNNIDSLGDIDFGSSLGGKVYYYGSTYYRGIEGSTLYDRTATNIRWYVGVSPDNGASDTMELTATALTVRADLSGDETVRIRSDANAGPTPTTELMNANFEIWDAADDTQLMRLGYTNSNDITLENKMNGGYIHFVLRDSANNQRNFLYGDPDGQSYLNGDTLVQLGVASSFKFIIDAVDIKNELPIKMLERAASAADDATYGQLWVKNTSPNELWFTDGDGGDIPIGFNSMPVYEIDAADSFDNAHKSMLWHKDANGAISFTCDNDSTIPQGATWVVFNDDTEDLTIAQGSGVTVYWVEAGSAKAAGDVTVSAGGIVTVYKYSDTVYYVWGAKEAGGGGGSTTLSALTDTTITSPADASLLLYDTGTATWRDAAMSGDATITDTGVITVSAATLADNSTLFNSLASTQFLRSDAADEKTAGHLGFYDNVYIQFGTGNDASLYWDGAYLRLTQAVANQFFEMNDGTQLRIYDSTDVDYLMFRDTGSQAQMYTNNNGMYFYSQYDTYAAAQMQIVSDVITFNVAPAPAASIPYNHNNTSSRDKVRVWSSSTYAIGMQSAINFGAIDSDYAMTFQMSNTSTRGFWWGDSTHATTAGAMALSTDGKLTVAHSIRLGYGETDSTVPGATYVLDVSGATSITGALTATSYGGITEANLVDKSASETISGAWTFTGIASFTSTSARFSDGVELYMGTGLDVTHYFSGTDYYIDLISGADFRLRGSSGSAAMITATYLAGVQLYYNNTEAFATQTTGTGQTSMAQVKAHSGTMYDVGFNNIPQFNFNVSDTLEAQHCGHATGKTNTGTYTLTGPASTDLDFPVGGVCTIMNLGSSVAYNIADTASCTMYIVDGVAGTITDIAGAATLGVGGIATLYRYSSAIIYLWGMGLTA